jgi:hypothetical protein
MRGGLEADTAASLGGPVVPTDGMVRSVRGIRLSSGLSAGRRCRLECRRIGLGGKQRTEKKKFRVFKFRQKAKSPRPVQFIMDPTQALIATYEDLSGRVHLSLRIHQGDDARLQAQSDEVRAFAVDAERVCRDNFTSCQTLTQCRHKTY